MNVTGIERNINLSARLTKIPDFSEFQDSIRVIVSYKTIGQLHTYIVSLHSNLTREPVVGRAVVYPRVPHVQVLG